MKFNQAISLKVLLILILFSAVCYGQNNSAANEQALENKFRLIDIEKAQEAQANLVKNLNEEIAKQHLVVINLQNEIALRDSTLNQLTDNIAYKNTLVTWGLTILAILVTFFGVVVPLIGFFFGRKLKEDIDYQSKLAKEAIKELKTDSEKDISRFISDSKEKFSILEGNALACIKNLKQYENDGQKMSQGLNELMDNIKSTNKLSEEERKKNIEKAQLVKTETGVTAYETDMAKALELYYKSEYEPALSMFETIIRKYHEITLDKLSNIYYQMAYCYLNLKNHEESIKFNLRALEFDPEDVYSLNNLAVSYQELAYTKKDKSKREYLEKAISCVEKALIITPNYSLAWYNLGSLFDDIGKKDEAENAYKKAIEFDEDYISPYQNLIEYYLLSNNIDLAQEYLKKAHRVENMKSPIILILEIFTLVLLGNWNKTLDETFAEIEKSVQTNPEDMNSWSFDYLKSFLQSIDKKYADFLSALINKVETYSF